MGNENIFQKLIKICGSKNVSNDPKILVTYSKDMSFVPEKMPIFVVWPSNTKEIEEIVKLANIEKFSIIPISSNKGPRHHGDTIPHKDDSIVSQSH